MGPPWHRRPAPPRAVTPAAEMPEVAMNLPKPRGTCAFCQRANSCYVIIVTLLRLHCSDYTSCYFTNNLKFILFPVPETPSLVVFLTAASYPPTRVLCGPAAGLLAWAPSLLLGQRRSCRDAPLQGPAPGASWASSGPS